MSSSSSNDSNTLLDTLSPQELSRLLTNPHMFPSIQTAFPPGSTPTAIIQNYAFMTTTIDALEQELERHHIERDYLYDRLLDSRRFRRRILPVLQEYRRPHRRFRLHPYDRSPTPPQTPSSPTSVNPPSSIEILPADALARINTPSSATSLASYRTAFDDTPGSRHNPIVISDDDVSPGWAKRQLRRIDERDNRT
jgi:hypothetical protein